MYISIGDNKIKVAIVGKYVQLEDSYISVMESLRHAGFANNVNVDIDLIDCEEVTAENVKEKLEKYQAIVVPGGFGNRGIEGKIETIKYARENNVPFLGICLGMQMTVVEFARNVLGLKDANSLEFDENTKNPVIHIMEEQKTINEKTTNPVIHIMEEQKCIYKKGGTMRLGAYECLLQRDSLAYKMYEKEVVLERHRHRYEYNNEYRETLENAGLICSGVSPDNNLVEIVELCQKEHPYFIAAQFHPEFKSRPNKPAPLFVGLIKSAKKITFGHVWGRRKITTKKTERQLPISLFLLLLNFNVALSDGFSCMLRGTKTHQLKKLACNSWSICRKPNFFATVAGNKANRVAFGSCFVDFINRVAFFVDFYAGKVLRSYQVKL